jgi:Fe-S-cluster containining protein
LRDDEDDPRPSARPLTTADGGGVSCYGRGRCCQSNPGWYGPGEVEETAALLGIRPDELVRRHLVVVSAQLPDEPGQPWVDLFAPVKVDEHGEPLTPTGARVPRVYELMRGPCVFYQAGRCAIHAARPVECRRYFCEQPEELNMTRAELARLWWDAARREG